MNQEIKLPKPMGDKLAGTQTEKNLHTALSAESQAYVRYLLFAHRAKSDGYVKVAQIFEETARNESEHAEIWFNLLGGLDATEGNLKVAMNGEHFEWEKMYHEFAQKAKEEGFDELAGRFERVAAIERRHEERYRTYLNQVSDGASFKAAEGETGTVWVCLACGQIWAGEKAPEHCPTCGHPQGYFARYKG